VIQDLAVVRKCQASTLQLASGAHNVARAEIPARVVVPAHQLDAGVMALRLHHQVVQVFEIAGSYG
jgi:hypothetical protein